MTEKSLKKCNLTSNRKLNTLWERLNIKKPIGAFTEYFTENEEKFESKKA
jgi:hypothetical protein